MRDSNAIPRLHPNSQSASRSPSLVSIITICRNAQDVLANTMVSVLSQRYSAIEYVIVDGLSCDRTVALASQVASRYPERQVRIVSEADQGISDAMNKGVLAASGTVIAHLHAGDRYIDDMVIEKVMASFQANGWRWAVASSVVVDARGQQLHTYNPREDYRQLLRQNSIPHQSTFLARDVFSRHGLFRVDLKQAMDYEFWLRIAFKGGERYEVLPFSSTYFLAGGRSARLLELLGYLIRLRRELRTYGLSLTWFDDTRFVCRVIAFSAYAAAKQAISRAL